MSRQDFTLHYRRICGRNINGTDLVLQKSQKGLHGSEWKMGFHCSVLSFIAHIGSETSSEVSWTRKSPCHFVTNIFAGALQLYALPAYQATNFEH